MNADTFRDVVEFIRSLYPNDDPIPLHAPRFLGNEKSYLEQCIDSTYVSYVGHFVTDFEEHIRRFVGANHAIAVVNGTAALHMALLAAGVKPGDGVVTQALTFAATAAAIRHAGAEPIFLDVDTASLSLSPERLEEFLSHECQAEKTGHVDVETNRRIGAVVPMHTFGHPARIAEIAEICDRFRIPLIEDAAESLGSWYRGQHTGTFGCAAILSFNGNKPVTTGGGGMVITDNESIATQVRHLSTTAKCPHPWEYFHDQVGYNLRLPNVNAAIGCAQMEYVDRIVSNKRQTAEAYKSFFQSKKIEFVTEREDCRSNYWLNAFMTKDRRERDEFLEYSNSRGIQTRPAWVLLHKLPPYSKCKHGELKIAESIQDRLVNIPSSVRI